MMNPIPAVAFFLLLFSSMCKLEELRCCYGWKDDEDKMQVFKQEKVKNIQCIAKKECEQNKCEIEYGIRAPAAETTDSPKPKNTVAADCFQWTPNATDPDDKECICATDWCNCPARLKTKDPKPKTKGLKCCDNSWNLDKIVEQVCPDSVSVDKIQPQGCIGRRWDNTHKLVTCGAGSLFKDNCTQYVDEPMGALQYTCYCTTDLCNCPSGITPSKGTPAPPATTSNTTSFQIRNSVPQSPLVFLGFFMTNKDIF